MTVIPIEEIIVIGISALACSFARIGDCIFEGDLRASYLDFQTQNSRIQKFIK